MNIGGFEIERKYLIRMPDPAYLAAHASPSRIEQTYLLRPAPQVDARVRKRGRDGAWVYTHTQKTRISDLRRIEDEQEISEEEYRSLLSRADPERRTICKTRWVLPYKGQDFEIDVFPFWEDRALMEIELMDEAQPVELPPEIEMIREVTGDGRYTNAAMSREIPFEDLQKGRTT